MNMKKAEVQAYEKKLALRFMALAILILGIGIFFWHRSIFSDPERVFWRMIDNNMQTYGVTRHIKQSSEAGYTEQYLQLELGANNAAKSVTTIEQKDQTGGTTRVVSESIGTQDANYFHYREITTPSQVDFGDTLSAWAKEPVSAESTSQSVFTEAMFGAVPFARLNPQQRAEVVKFIRDNNVYKADFSSSTKTEVDGKTAQVFKVEIDTVKYIEMLKLVDKLSGLNQLTLIDPSSYASSPTIPIEMSIAIDSSQLLRLRYDAIEREEHFSGYGVQPGFVIPEATLTRPELEQQLQNSLQGQD